MTKYALDTNIITYYLKGDKNIISRVTEETDNENCIIIYDFTLVTNNEKHFSRIAKLKTINWL